MAPNELQPQTRTVREKAEDDAAFTEQVIAATGSKAHPRLAEIMPSLVRHLHAFAREVDLTVAEWTAAVNFVRASSFRCC